MGIQYASKEVIDEIAEDFRARMKDTEFNLADLKVVKEYTGFHLETRVKVRL